MRVILNDHIDHLGERGDVVEVKPGYARNYLLPKGLAYVESEGNRRRFGQEQGRWEEMDLERKSAAEKVATEMDGTRLRFERRAGEKDVLFGSVSLVDIGRALAELGFDVDRRRILLGHPIKELGSFEVDVRVHRDITVTIPIEVVRPGDQPGAAVDEFESIEGAEPDHGVEGAVEAKGGDAAVGEEAVDTAAGDEVAESP
jgi:large subunit ribosomal protein L9